MDDCIRYPIILIEVCGLAPSTKEQVELERRVAILEDRDKSRHEGHTFRNTLLSILVPVLTAVMSWGWFVTSNIFAMKQQLADGGNKQIVAELRKPKSQQQLNANLSTVVAQIETARADGTKPNAAKVGALSQAVSDVVQKNPSLDRGWQAAAELISYRNETFDQGERKACAQDKDAVVFIKPRLIPTDPVLVQDVTFMWHDCTLSLDDNPILKDTIAVKELERGMGKFNLIVRNVHVVYRGGVIPKFDAIQFDNCTFDFNLPQAPPDVGRRMTTQLLAASNVQNVTVTTKLG